MYDFGVRPEAAILEGFSEPYRGLPLSAPFIFFEFDRLPHVSSRPYRATTIHTPAEQYKSRRYLLLLTPMPLNVGAVLKLSCFPALPFPKGMVSIWPAGQLVV
jgi:hypothetical protein